MSKRKEKVSDNIMKFGIFGDITFENKRIVKDLIFNLKTKFSNNIMILSLGNYAGADKLVKKYALEMGCTYKEHNPVHTSYTLYSAFPPDFYDKKWHPFRANLHVNSFTKECDMFIVLTSKLNPTEKFSKQVTTMTKKFTKLKKNFTLIQDSI